LSVARSSPKLLVQKLINQYGDSIGLSVNQRKCAVINLDPDPPPPHCSIWNSPFVGEYRYLGVLLGLAVPTEKVFAAALEKLKARARLFGCIKTNFTSRVLLAKIYLYPLVSYLLNFYAFPVATEKAFVSATSNRNSYLPPQVSCFFNEKGNNFAVPRSAKI